MCYDGNKKTGLILPSNLSKIRERELSLGRKLTDEELDKYVLTEEELKLELEKAEEDIKNGRCYSIDEAFRMLREHIR